MTTDSMGRTVPTLSPQVIDELRQRQAWLFGELARLEFLRKHEDAYRDELSHLDVLLDIHRNLNSLLDIRPDLLETLEYAEDAPDLLEAFEQALAFEDGPDLLEGFEEACAFEDALDADITLRVHDAAEEASSEELPCDEAGEGDV